VWLLPLTQTVSPLWAKENKMEEYLEKFNEFAGTNYLSWDEVPRELLVKVVVSFLLASDIQAG
jgi:hypothetical protein